MAVVGCAPLEPVEQPEIAISSATPDPITDVFADQLFEVMAAEMAGQRGLLEEAIDRYLELALEVDDARIAARATRISIFAQDSAKALLAAERWVELHPFNPEARQVAAAMQLRSGDVEAGIAHLEALVQTQDGDLGTSLRLVGNLLSGDENKQVVLEAMRELVQTYGNQPEALLSYALISLRLEELSEARKVMDELLEDGAVDAQIAQAYAAVLQRSDQQQVALAWVRRAREAKPDDVDLKLLYARLLADTKRYEEAREEFERLVALQPENADIRYALALLHLQAGASDAARQHLLELVDRGQRSQEASFYLGQIAELDADFAGAIEWFEKVTTPANRFDATLRIAINQARLEKTDDALDTLAEARAEDDLERNQLVRVRGEILTDAGRYTEALAIYDAALADQFDEDLLYTRAMLGEKMGRLDILERDLTAVIEYNPENAQALNALGYTLADRTDRYQEAYELIKRALEASPEDYYTLDSMGWVLYRLGRLDEAVTYLRRALAIQPDAEVAAHLGEVLWVKGDREEAKEIWDTALQATPDHKLLKETQERLAQ